MVISLATVTDGPRTVLVQRLALPLPLPELSSRQGQTW